MDNELNPVQGAGNMPLSEEEAAKQVAFLKKQKALKGNPRKPVQEEPIKKKPKLMPKMAGGGPVRGYGKARGGKACKMR